MEENKQGPAQQPQEIGAKQQAVNAFLSSHDDII